ncbi:MAG: aminotransferase class III-fold pyridoxal phosphate-dependent enzyme [Thermomicrobiales bacterium]
MKKLSNARAPGTIAAMIGEPVQRAGGVVPPPQSYWTRVKEILDANNILLIADEVITGFGRTGTMFGVQQYDVQPDIVSIAKGVTSGYIPLGAVGVTDQIYETMLEPDAMFMHGFTYSGHPVACAVGLKNVGIIENENLEQNAGEIGAYLIERLGELMGHQNVGDVRGKGMMMIVEVVKDTGSKGAVHRRRRCWREIDEGHPRPGRYRKSRRQWCLDRPATDTDEGRGRQGRLGGAGFDRRSIRLDLPDQLEPGISLERCAHWLPTIPPVSKNSISPIICTRERT